MTEPHDEEQYESKLVLWLLYGAAIFCSLIAMIYIGILAATNGESSLAISRKSAERVMKVALFCFFFQLVGSTIYWGIRAFSAK
jgi:hypothetical protein